MIAVLSHYLDSVRDNLRLSPSSERDVIGELETHIEDRLEELRAAGLSEEDAANTCIRLLGSARLVARQIYEAHSQGTWRQALLASMPHLIFGMLFALNWYRGIAAVLGVLALILAMAVYGWWRGKPAWLFPWLGYCLLPVLAGGLLLLLLPRGWSWVAILLYIPLVLWLFYAVTVRAIRRDWLYSSLMLLPVPTIIGWFLVVEPVRDYQGPWIERVYDVGPWIGLSFLALGVTAATFIRLRQRWLRISVLVLSGVMTLTIIAYYAEGRLSLPAFLVLIVVTLNLLLSPALVERRLRRGRERLPA